METLETTVNNIEVTYLLITQKLTPKERRKMLSPYKYTTRINPKKEDDIEDFERTAKLLNVNINDYLVIYECHNG